MGAALRILGYSVTGPNGVRDANIARNVHEMAYALVDRFDAFQDNPWPVLYEDLDAKYPGSKFILTLREPSQWIQSQVRHFGINETPMRTWIYGKGCPEGNEELYIERFLKHNRDVLSYFKDRPDDLLVMNLAMGDGWQKLCAFLDAEVPDISFPHANQAEQRENNGRLFRRLGRMVARRARKLTR